ncbi:MAG: hypothetical protein QN194_15655 [Armatimonadota bacterium]|nr:hypothetical protein [Armatimonadota bacterium]
MAAKKDSFEAKVERALRAIEREYELDPRGEILLALVRDAWQQYREVRAQLAREGMVRVGPRGRVRLHSLVAAEERLRAALLRTLGMLQLEGGPPEVVLEGKDSDPARF